MGGDSRACCLLQLFTIHIDPEVGQRAARLQQAALLRVLDLLGLGPVRLGVAIDHAIALVHHAQDERLVGGVQRRYRDVAHGSELTAIVQMLVLQAEKVPNKAAGGGS